MANISHGERHDEKMFNLSAFTLSLSISSNSIIYCPISDLENVPRESFGRDAAGGDVGSETKEC